MNPQEKLVAEIKAAIEEKFNAQVQTVKTELGDEIKTVKTDFTEINAKLDKLKGNSEALVEIKASIDKINEAQKAQGDFLDGLKFEEGKKADKNTDEYSDVLKKAFEEAGFNFNKDDDGNEYVVKGNAGLNNDLSKNMPIEIKAAHVMGSGDVTGNAIPLDFATMGKDIIPVNTNDHVTDYFTTRTTSEVKTMTLLVEYNLEGDIATTDEGDASGLISIQLKSKDFTIFDASVMATIAWRQNMETPELMDAIKRIVPDRLKQYLDRKILTIAGDNTSEPWGCMHAENGTPFNALEYAGLGLAVANVVDLIVFMKNQCKTADYSANGIYMGDKRRLQIAAIRDTTNNNIADRRLAFDTSGNLNRTAGLVIKESRLLPSTLIVSVTNMNRIKFAKGMNVTVGFNADDLSKRRLSTVWSFLYGYGSQNVNANIYTNSIDADLAIINELAAASLARINGYAAGSDATDMTVQMMFNAGGTDVRPEELENYKTAVAAETGIADAAALQVVIDAVNP